jgi:acyl-CoA thioesterase-1
MTETLPPPRRSFSRICFIGDAFTVGAGDETGLGWVGRVAQAEWGRNHDVAAYNVGGRFKRSVGRLSEASPRAQMCE